MGDNGGPRLVACCWSLAAAAGILLGLRIYCKLWRGRGLWWDDHVLIASWLTLAISVSLNTYIVSLGFGMHMDTISDENLKTISLFTILVAVFGLIATTTSKTSVALTLYRIVLDRWIKWALIFIIISSNITMNLIWVFGFAKCTPLEKVWDPSVPGTCWDKQKLLKYQLFASYYSAALDFLLALLPWKIIMGMTMRRREKIGVAIAMSLGAVAGITGIVKAVLAQTMTSTDFTYARVDLTIWTLTEPAASIMAISIPILRMFYQEFKSSRKSSSKTRSQSNQEAGTAGRSHAGTNADVRRSRMHGMNLKNGGNSVVIMSSSRWQESQEALKDMRGSDGLGESLSSHHGILRTEEVKIHRDSASGDNSIELGPMGMGTESESSSHQTDHRVDHKY